LFLQPGEPLGQARKREAVGGVFGLEPAGAQAELDPSAAHLVHLGDGDRQRPGQPERRRAHQRAKPDAAGLQCEASKRGPCVGRPRQPSDIAHLEIVVGPEECVELQLLRGARYPGERLVGSSLLWLSEDPELHDPILTHCGQATHAVSLEWSEQHAGGHILVVADEDGRPVMSVCSRPVMGGRWTKGRQPCIS